MICRINQNEKMSEKVLVSVYCLAYNHEQYIRDALEGFINQKTSFKYEVFVHDDASTDNTAAIIMEYSRRYPEIIKPIIQKENQYSKNVKIVKNIIAPCMSGKYVAVCEGDDFWISSNKLQKQVDFLEQNPEYVACVHETLERNEKSGEERYINGSKEDKDIEFKDVIQGGNTCFQLSSLVYRKEYLDHQPDFFQLKIEYGDYKLAMYLALEGKIRYFHECMSIYRLYTQGSWTSRNSINEEAIIRTRKKDIILLKAVDEYSKNKYSKDIKKVIFKKEYEIFCRSEKKELKLSNIKFFIRWIGGKIIRHKK